MNFDVRRFRCGFKSAVDSIVELLNSPVIVSRKPFCKVFSQSNYFALSKTISEEVKEKCFNFQNVRRIKSRRDSFSGFFRRLISQYADTEKYIEYTDDYRKFVELRGD